MTTWQERMAWILTHRLSWGDGKGELVYHAHFSRVLEGVGTDMRVRSFSICGLVISEWKGGRELTRFTMFDEGIAQRIARPCKHCYEVRDDAAS